MSVRYIPGESLEFFVPLCGDEQLRALWVEDIAGTPDQGDDQVLWRVDATSRARPVTKLEFGAEPDGFNGQGLTSLGELESRYRDSELAVHASTDEGNPLGLFTVDQLPTDGSAVLEGTSDRVVSVAELERAQRDRCSPTAAEEILAGASRGAFVAAAIGGVAWLVVRRWRSSRATATT